MVREVGGEAADEGRFPPTDERNLSRDLAMLHAHHSRTHVARLQQDACRPWLLPLPIIHPILAEANPW